MTSLKPGSQYDAGASVTSITSGASSTPGNERRVQAFTIHSVKYDLYNAKAREYWKEDKLMDATSSSSEDEEALVLLALYRRRKRRRKTPKRFWV